MIGWKVSFLFNHTRTVSHKWFIEMGVSSFRVGRNTNTTAAKMMNWKVERMMVMMLKNKWD